MTNFDELAFTELIKQKDIPAAKQMILDYLDNAVTPAERGAALAGFVQAYMRASSKLDQEMNRTMQEAITVLEQLDAAKNQSSDKIQLDEARKNLNI